MGMYTELVMGIQITNCEPVIEVLEFMLNPYNIKLSKEITDMIIEEDHPLFKTSRWETMLVSDSYYFDSQTDSKLFKDNLYKDYPMYFLNIRSNLKNYDNEIEKFLDWLNLCIVTNGFLGYMRYEENKNPTLIYKENNKIRYKEV